MNLGRTKMNMKKFVPAKLTVSALAVSLMALSHSASAAGSKIMNLLTEQKSSDTTELRFSFEGQPVTPEAYQLNDKLVLDFKSVSSAVPSQQKNVHAGLVDSIQTVVGQNNTRVLLGLDEAAQYTSYVEGQDLVLTVSSGEIARTMSSADATMMGRPTSSTNNRGANHSKQEMVVRVNPLLTPSIKSSHISSQYSYDGLSAVNFSGNGKGGEISIALNNAAIPVDVQRQGDKILVRLSGSTIPKRLLKRMDVNNPLVSSIDANNRGRNGTITINMTADFEYQAYQTGDKLHISVTQPTQIEEPTLEDKVYSGEPLSMEFQDVPIRAVLDVLAMHTDMNIVVADNVAGNITLRLVNVPWDQALDIILESKGLGMIANGNVIVVKPAKEIAEEEIRRLTDLKNKEALDPVRIEYIRLSYSKAEDVMKLISSSGGSRGKDSVNDSLLSKQGSVSVDARTNTLIVKDTSESISNIRALIAKIDIPVKQVMIEARIVSATDNFSKDIGVKWGILSNGAATNNKLLVGGSNQTLWDLKEFDIESTTINGREVSYPSYDISRPDNLNVNLGAANPAGSIAFSLLTMSDLMLDLELSAMQADNKGEVISTPKVLTADKKTAKISSGTLIPYESVSSDGTKTEFEEAALSLQVTPNITPDGKIGLELDIKNGTPTIINGAIAISEDNVQTNVLVEDGQTVVLGGVFKNTISGGVSKVPFLGDLPYVGRLFRNDRRSNDKQELLIFITTRIVNDNVSNF